MESDEEVCTETVNVLVSALVSETRNLVQTTYDITTRLSEFIPQPDQEYIYWANVVRRTGSISLNSAPLSISTLLEKHLFSQNQSVILTGATLSTNGTFDHIRERTGFTDAKELIVFCHTLAAAGCTSLYLSCICSDSKIRYERILCFTTAMANNARIPGRPRYGHAG